MSSCMFPHGTPSEEGRLQLSLGGVPAQPDTLSRGRTVLPIGLGGGSPIVGAGQAGSRKENRRLADSQAMQLTEPTQIIKLNNKLQNRTHERNSQKLRLLEVTLLCAHLGSIYITSVGYFFFYQITQHLTSNYGAPECRLLCEAQSRSHYIRYRRGRPTSLLALHELS